jgi:hypothetical protein
MIAQAQIISLKGINRLVCVKEGKCFVWEIRTEASQEQRGSSPSVF